MTYKKIKNEYNKLVKKSKKRYFQDNANEGSATSKSFWNIVKPFISSKRTLSRYNIIIEAPNNTTLTVKGNLVYIKAKNEIPEEKILVEMFNSYYINIAEKSSESAPKSVGNPSNPGHDKYTVQNAIQCCKESSKHSQKFFFRKIEDLAPFNFSKHNLKKFNHKTLKP